MCDDEREAANYLIDTAFIHSITGVEDDKLETRMPLSRHYNLHFRDAIRS